MRMIKKWLNTMKKSTRDRLMSVPFFVQKCVQSRKHLLTKKYKEIQL